MTRPTTMDLLAWWTITALLATSLLLRYLAKLCTTPVQRRG